jgi:hypothetical protein
MSERKRTETTCLLCNTDRRKEIIASTITDRSQAPIKQSRRYERLSENLCFAKLASAVISSSALAMFVGRSDYTGRMKRLCAQPISAIFRPSFANSRSFVYRSERDHVFRQFAAGNYVL